MCAYTSLAILCVFWIEQILTMYIEGLSHYFTHVGFVVDFFVLSVSIGFEVAQISGTLGGANVGWLVLARVWRFARVAHGVYECVESKNELAEELAEKLSKAEHEVVVENKAIKELQANHTQGNGAESPEADDIWPDKHE